MTRLVLSILAVLGILWLLVVSNVLPPALAGIASVIVNGAVSVACPLFLLSLFLAPGLYRDASGSMGQMWERVRTRRHVVEDLQRKIMHLDKPHHMLQLGAVYMRQGHLAKAVDWLSKALEKDPDSLDARYKLALCFFDQGLYARSAELLEEIHRLKPDHDYGTAYLRLAESQHRLGNLERAAEVYRTLLRFYPGQPEGTFYYATLLAQDGPNAEADKLMHDVVFTVRHSPAFQRRRNRHWMYKAQWWLWRRRSSPS